MKIEDNKESLLRCILEIATYYQVISKSKFITSYSKEIGQLTEKDIKKAILIMKGSTQHSEMKDIQMKEREYLNEILKELEVHVFCCDRNKMDIVKLSDF
ncbi:hypothetical protein HZF08_01815 [Paenibacillus sp. CGMCC 1.16610]|uniref:Uncharacterized protein n=1 Tax=Paenibacillus anseongense TaxID=2682845 RepID=A0ABW9U1Q2_9BACL|nr:MULTISPECIES: hypothetical protein [Paenibacillus]MBA2937037.1 hypothetical protein [Paenibacillus sp. CGMCC 1.16610]MVQ33361.1 hypothetical protein [Paenibacillus anseongense]